MVARSLLLLLRWKLYQEEEDNMLLNIFLIICILIGLSCVFIDFFMDVNDEINNK